MTAPLSSTREKMMDVDALANEIRRLDGDHLNRLGAGALAEALMPFIRRSPSPDVAVSRDAGAGAWLLGRVTKQTDEFEGLPDNSIVRVSVHLADLRRARAAIRALSSAPSAAEGDQK